MSFKLRVYYEDTDAGGIVYHTNYIKFCERARSELFFQQNHLPSDGEKSGFVVRSINANFLGTAMLGDMLNVTTELLKKRKASLVLEQSIYKEDKLIFKMEVTLAFVSSGRPKIIPEHLHNILDFK